MFEYELVTILAANGVLGGLLVYLIRRANEQEKIVTVRK